MYFLSVHCATLAMSSKNVVADEIADQEVDQEAKGSSDEFSIDGVVYAIETDHYPLDDDDDPGYNSENDAFYQLANSAGQSGQPSCQSLVPPPETIFSPAPSRAFAAAIMPILPSIFGPPITVSLSEEFLF